MKTSIFISVLALLFATCSPKQENSSLKKLLLQQLKNSHSQEEWFAPIVPAVSGVTAEQASWKDSTGNHSIGQLVSHLAFWNERVLKAFQGNTPPDFTGNNEVTFKQLSKEEWDTVRNKLDTIQLKLEQMVEKASDEQLEEWCGTISNLAMHNAYHTGQIVYIRKKNGWWKNPK